MTPAVIRRLALWLQKRAAVVAVSRFDARRARQARQAHAAAQPRTADGRWRKA